MEFNCYIEESGDPGFYASPSETMIFTGLIVKKEYDRDVANIMKDIKDRFNCSPQKALRWRSLNRSKKRFAISKMKELPVVFTNVIVHKEYLEQATYLLLKNKFYNYGIRLLLERAGWFTRDNQGVLCNPIFHYISDFPYEELSGYLKLIELTEPQMVKGIWGKLQYKPANYKMIELADFFCGTVANAFNSNRYGQYDPGYLKEVGHLLYSSGTGPKRLTSYGLKSLTSAQFFGFRWLS